MTFTQQFLDDMDELKRIHSARNRNINIHFSVSMALIAVGLALRLTNLIPLWAYLAIMACAPLTGLLSPARRWPWSKPVLWPSDRKEESLRESLVQSVKIGFHPP